jgi:ribonuclease HII
MRRASEIYPGYGFEKHHGYGTKQHREALASLGVVDIHRKSYQPIRDLINNGISAHRG